MPGSRLPRYSVLLRLLRVTLVAGAVYDVAFALAMVFFPTVPARWLALPLPGEPYYLWLIALLLVMLAAVYLLAAYDPISYQGNITVAIVGRTTGAFLFALAAWDRPDLAGLWALAAADLAFGLSHAAFWLPVRP